MGLFCVQLWLLAITLSCRQLSYGPKRDRQGCPYGELGSDEQGNTYYRFGADAGTWKYFTLSLLSHTV